MTTLFVRPGHLHTPARILSATNESGLVVGGAVPTTGNAGQLRLSTAKTPFAAVDAVVRVQTGGNPTGYQPPGGTRAPGCAVAWRKSTDTVGQVRGYVDRQHLVRVEFPIANAGGSGHGIPSTPRTLADGALGVLMKNLNTGLTRFYRIATGGVLVGSPATLGDATTTTSNGYRSDFCVLGSGRLVAAVKNLTNLYTFYSDDHGATWTQLGTQTALIAGDVVCLEVIDDTIVMVSGFAASSVVNILLSLDGGATYTYVGTSTAALTNPRSCVAAGQILLSSANHTAGNLSYVYPLAAGGLPGDAINTAVTSELTAAVVTSDDGSVWVYGYGAGTNYIRAACGVSTDGGTTWVDPAGGAEVLDCETAAYAQQGYPSWSAGTWQGRNVLVATTDSTGGTDGVFHLLTFGGWESVPESSSEAAFKHSYLSIDLPENLSWTRTNVGAGATVTAAGPLNVVSTGAVASTWQSSAAQWTTGAACTRRLRFRLRVNSGGSVADDRSRIRIIGNDGAGNEQELKIRFSTTAAKLYDGAANVLATATRDMTVWTEFRVDFTFGASPVCSVWARADTDDVGLWTNILSAQALVNAAGVLDCVRIGGSVVGAADLDVAYIGFAETGLQSNGMTNPSGVTGRCLSAQSPGFMLSGVHVGGKNGNASPGDTYALRTSYSYGKQNIWQELRPSRHCRATGDNASWNVVFDAGVGDRFKGDGVALFGTNFRTASLEFNTADSWGAPAATISLDATLTSGTVGAGNRGRGYVGPTATPNWRIGQYKSDGDGHRFFLEVSGAVYEITDNDTTRIYVEDTDLSAAAGTFRIFGDKMGGGAAFSQYRYMRLLVGAQETADNYYRVGTLVFDVGFTPAQLYDHGFVDRYQPVIEMVETDAGYRATSRLGPRRHTLSIQWPPLALLGPASDVEARLRDFYTSLEGSHRPFVFWRDVADLSTLGLFRLVGTYSASNVWGELTTALTRVDQLVLEEER